ncbi:MAG: TMEM165/GDT1 family protein [Elusimicrobiota bacterium]
MQWKILLTTFAAIFAAELADKTQLVGITLTAKTGRPVLVWLGSVSAYMVITALSVIAGSLLSKYVDPKVIKIIGGIIFMLIGGMMLISKS